ncbi:MAG TPA: ATP-binding protein [Kofleriaceae bacterium]|nr:ATP-binding protein [Kofleriaceae bacterium]
MSGAGMNLNDETLRTLLDIAPDSIAILRGQIVLYMSPSGARILGFDRPADVIGLSLADWLSPTEYQIAIQRIGETMRTGRAVGLPRDYRVRGRDGKTSIIEVATVGITYEDEPAVLAFVRDVSERKALERQVAESARLAALGRLSAGVAHELNNPLTHLVLAVDGLRRTLAQTPPDPAAALTQARDKLDLIAQDIERMVVIARELRLFASPQPGARRPVDLRQPLEDALRAVRETHPAASKLQVERHYDEVAAAESDPIRLEQVFVNLLTNAFDSLSEAGGGRVTVELHKASAEAVAVRVCDEGAGIPEDLLERVFEPFFTTKAYGKGAGLGLAISRSVVQALGGALDVESETGRGTTFTVTLPAWRPPMETPEPRPPLSDRRLRVLVVDDEAAIGRALAAFLHTHEVVVTSSVAEALAQIERDAAFDVILCDVVMPGSSGVEFHRSLAAARPGLERRVVFMTGATLGSDDGRALAALPNQMLEKPFDLDRLERVLDDAAR